MTLNRWALLFLFSFCFVQAYAAEAQGQTVTETMAPEIHGSLDSSLTYNSVKGNNSANSSLTKGLNYLDVLGLYGNGKYKDFDYNFNASARATDDKRMDNEKWSMTSLQGRISNKTHTFTVGDVFESLSQYTLNSQVKGASYKLSPQGGLLPEVTLVEGLAYPRWDNFYGGRDEQAVKKQVSGVRVRENVTEKFALGMNTVASSDQERSRIFDSDQLYNNHVYSLDAEFKPIDGVTMTSEGAFSRTVESPAAGVEDSKYGGRAYHVEIVGDQDPSRVSLEYEKVTPQFLTVLGSATPDREKVKTKWRYKVAKNVTMNTAFLTYWDDLNGQKSYRTKHYKPEIGFTFRKLLDRQYAVADISYKFDKANGGGYRSGDSYTNLNYRDRFWLLDTDSNFGMIAYRQSPGVNKSNEFTYNTTVSSRHTVGAFVLKPSIYLGGWNSKNELAAISDKVYEEAVGLGVDIPRAKITSNIKAGKNRLIKQEVNTGSTKDFANLNIFYRPPFLAKLNQGMIFLKAFVNDFNAENVNNSYRETSVTMGMTLEF